MTPAARTPGAAPASAAQSWAVRGRVVTADAVLVDGVVVVAGEMIAWVGEAARAAEAGHGADVVAAVPHDGYVLPGLVDLHCHGGGGESFPDATGVAQVHDRGRRAPPARDDHARRLALPSWGHTDAGPHEARAALAESASMLARPGARSARPTITHLFNAMPPWQHRDPGPVGEFLVAARCGTAVVELVGDGTQLRPEVVTEVYQLVGRDGVVLVTDAMAAAGQPDGDYQLGSRSVVVRDGAARLQEGGAIAGGTAHLLDVVRTTVQGGVPLVDAVHMAATGPARVLGSAPTGALAAGRRADLLLTDDDLRCVAVARGGSWLSGNGTQRAPPGKPAGEPA